MKKFFKGLCNKKILALSVLMALVFSMFALSKAEGINLVYADEEVTLTFISADISKGTLSDGNENVNVGEINVTVTDPSNLPTITATAAEGYYFLRWENSAGVKVSDAAAFKPTQLQASKNETYKAVFGKGYTVTVEVNDSQMGRTDLIITGDTISKYFEPDEVYPLKVRYKAVVSEGSSCKIKLISYSGYEIDFIKLLKDGYKEDYPADLLQNAKALGYITINDINKNETIYLTYTKKSYKISILSSGEGTVSPTQLSFVRHGESQKVSFTPQKGYEVLSIKVNGIKLTGEAFNKAVENGFYEFADVVGNQRIEVIFGLPEGTKELILPWWTGVVLGGIILLEVIFLILLYTGVIGKKKGKKSSTTNSISIGFLALLLLVVPAKYALLFYICIVVEAVLIIVLTSLIALKLFNNIKIDLASRTVVEWEADEKRYIKRSGLTRIKAKVYLDKVLAFEETRLKAGKESYPNRIEAIKNLLKEYSDRQDD